MSNWLVTLSISFILIYGAGCQNGLDHLSPKRDLSDELQVGSKPFQFDPTQVTEVSLAKFDPELSGATHTETGDNGSQWLAHLRRTGKQWNISTDQPILDSIADDTFVFHLIDSLRSIQVVSAAPRGPLESFALNPPRFGIEWKTPEKVFEFRLGARLRDGKGYYFTVDRIHVFVASGSAFNMLNLIHSFQTLRKRSWTSLIPDDVDQIELKRRGKSVLYAQREGDLWTDRNHRQVKKDMNSLLERAILAQPQQIIDDLQLAVKLRKQIQSNLLYELQLSDRSGNVNSLKLSLQKDVLYGMNTSRPDGVFILDRKFLLLF